VYEGGVAHQAGLSAGDVLIAIDDLRVTASNLDTLLKRYRNGDLLHIHAFRRDELMQFTAQIKADTTPQFALTLQEKPVARVRLRKSWLRGRK
jgi:predicted metalloprotease with PDZ domain